MGRIVAFTGRLLFAFIFFSSGLQKLSHFDIVTGGPEMEYMEPRMDAFLNTVAKSTGIRIPLPKFAYPYLLLIAVLLELAGGTLFVLNRRMGAHLLLLFMVAVTPIMHAFWDLPENTPEQLHDMIHFFKNISMTGALLFYLGQ
ncbi:hypothetical protein H632_c842p0 [Helicosporidium sp. ATCC 50920]|nr:hypothetical protein H632_c842p0 [Helicosporidium sp. ATCC 50920]|eukprot:KDD75148.1 hypothetical protein H632_c842p0 [Helicosporidium sp. ATCC 50920]